MNVDLGGILQNDDMYDHGYIYPEHAQPPPLFCRNLGEVEIFVSPKILEMLDPGGSFLRA